MAPNEGNRHEDQHEQEDSVEAEQAGDEANESHTAFQNRLCIKAGKLECHPEGAAASRPDIALNCGGA